MKIQIARLLIVLVTLINVQCALIFVFTPSWFAPSYELSGEVGDAVIRAFGILFLMWNVPYVVAAWQPQRYRVSVWQAVIMQAIGLVGETVIFFSLTGVHPILRESILRFIIFDGGGLLALILALIISAERR